MTLRNHLARAVGAGALAALLLVPASSASAAHRHDYAGQAAASYAALQRYLAAGDGLFHERVPVAAGDNPYSYEWPFSQVHAATLDLTGLPGRQGTQYDRDLKAGAAGQEHYWKADGGTTGLPGYASYPVAPYGAGGDFFYDDNEWVGLLDVQDYLTSANRSSLTRAKQIFDLVRSGWDTDPAHAAPGGVFWTQASWSTDRNTVSNMPGAELGLRLYQITHDRTYLEWSLKMYTWTNEHLLSPSGLYWDHLDLAGNVEPTFWSYNQGVPIGVNVLLYQVTHDRTYLHRAQSIATAANTYFGAGGRLAAQPPVFNAIYFKNLLLLESATGGHTYRDAMAAYADEVWSTNRDAATGLFVFDSDGSTEVIQQAAMTEIYAVLAWDPARYRVLY